MRSPHSVIQLLVITSCLFIVGASCTQAQDTNKNSNTTSSEAPSKMNPMMMGQMNGMMNPHLYMNMMAQMNGMMNPMTMMGGGMGGMSPMMGMNMMYPMMGMMGPMSAMSGGMTQPGGQMMDPKQYEQWFNQWTEMMKNFAAQQMPQQTK